MLESLASDLGPWSWLILGIVLLGAELAAPGVFLIWIGGAAIVVGALSLLLWNAAFWSWQLQFVLFAALAFVFAFAGRRFYSRHEESDEPLLNRRGESLVGRTATLHEPIREGRGRIRLDDTWWPVMGPDLPAGTQVRVVAAQGRDLRVEPA